jgi:Cytochrome bd terminal oxidase subunit I
MDTTALMLSRLQFAFTVSFHIIFPSFTIGLAAWLTVLEALHLITGRPAYRRVFDFWLKIFGIAFGMGVVSGSCWLSSSARTGANSRRTNYMHTPFPFGIRALDGRASVHPGDSRWN